MMNKKIKILLLLVGLYTSALANEGMWIPSLLKKYNIEEMQKMGFKLTAKDIYDVNNNSMKDAVVLFGKGCTGEMVSDKGLLFTNHHCGYGEIQAHSSVENDYLTNGFWAKNSSEELPNPGLEVRFLERMDDVSEMVFKETENLSVVDKEKKIKKNIVELQKKYSTDKFTQAVVKPLFKGNQYFVYVYKVFKDVRLVGAPPSAIGKFGGDTDNWMWPRHTADFSVFRVYADENNQPAEYSESNVPYKPKYHFPISIKGVQPEDFVMVFGFPGSTDQYLPSYAVDLLMNQTDPDRIAIRDAKLSILRKHMEADKKVRIQYSAKYASASNGWKKWQGEINGLKRLNAIERKENFEKEFTNWLNKSEENKEKYSDVLPRLKELYVQLTPQSKAYYYLMETWYYGTDIMNLAFDISRATSNWDEKSEQEKNKAKEKLKETIEAHFKDYNLQTDEEVFVTLLRKLYNDLDTKYINEAVVSVMSKYSNEQLLSKIYRKSILTDKESLTEWLHEISPKLIDKIKKDPLMKLSASLAESYYLARTNYRNTNIEIEELEKRFMAGIMEMRSGDNIYPDANNLTMRVAYGKVEGYQPKDGVIYKHYTTLNGIIEKDNPEIYDYNVPEKLKQLFFTKNYGQYAKNGELHTAFIASVHTTGGNSGSPAVNANGELIGINFDRCWEGTMSDIMFDPDRCRNIMVDSRYVLFIIDKFAEASYLLKEMTIVK